jgi:Vibrio phage DNA polymerase
MVRPEIERPERISDEIEESSECESPRETKSKKKIRRLAVLDTETDPFLYGRVPAPFVVGIYLDSGFTSFWGDDCILQSMEFLAAQGDEWIIYAHNGGKFDWMYYLAFISGSLKIINGRIVSAKLCGHEIRDSFAIMPFPLRDYKKDEIDYRHLEKRARNKHRAEILSYLESDCKYLYELCSTFHAEFGQQKLTIGSTSMGEIKKLHPFERTTITFDRIFRKDFYYGGRVECFDKTGIIDAPVKIYDVNSMYPAMMRDYPHPSGSAYITGDEITDDTCFVIAEGESAGAFPSRSKAGLGFPHGRGKYCVSRFEYDAGIDTGTFRPDRIVRTFDFPLRTAFTDFVTHFYGARQKAGQMGDSVRKLLFKFTLNSGYGKFAQNPANFSDWVVATLKCRPHGKCEHCHGKGMCWLFAGCFKCQALNDYERLTDGCCMFCGGTGERWQLHEYDTLNPDGPMIWKARTFVQSYYNVATGASITGAARATLLRGLAMSDRPIYCDTDSIITEGDFHGPVSTSELGYWKFEGCGVLSAIAGKKLYAIFDDKAPDLSDEDRRKYPWMVDPVKFKGKKFWCIKKAHKGLKLSPAEILQIAQGWEIEVANHAPTFGLFREPTFIKRVARKTV